MGRFKLLCNDVVIHKEERYVHLGTGIVLFQNHEVYCDNEVVVRFTLEDVRLHTGERFGTKDPTPRYYSLPENNLKLLFRKVKSNEKTG